MSDPSLGSLDWLGVQLRVREPESDEPAGALILNHGRGADHNDLYGLLDELDPSGGCSA